MTVIIACNDEKEQNMSGMNHSDESVYAFHKEFWSIDGTIRDTS